MTVNFPDLYESLVRDINHILYRDLSEKEKMELCFRCSIEHWNRLKEEIKGQGFDSDEEEIHFFKQIKPRFTGEIEYYTQRYHALLFLPETDKQEQLFFWEGELGRIDKFFVSYHAFLEYYGSSKTNLDHRYFLRRNNDGSNLAHANVFDLDQQTAASHDWLLTNMIGYQKYKKFILAEMEKL
jgi:hypothetical protein